MSINYVAKHAQAVEEAFNAAAMTNALVNQDVDFVGAKTVKIHTVPTVSMGDYTRSGANRYGQPAELEDSTYELTMGKDRAFTFTIDKMNSEEDQALSAGAALNRQIREVIVPEIDKYRLARMAAGAGNAVYGAFTGNGATGPYEHILDIQKALDDDGVPSEGRVCVVSSAFYKALKMDSNFVKASDIAQGNIINGQLGEVDGLPILKDHGRLPTGVSCMVTHPSACCAPQKLAEYKTHMDPPGISGVLVEGRQYFDAFVLDKKRDAIGTLRSTIMPLTVTNAAGASGKTKFTAVTGHTGELGCEMGTLVYKIASGQTAPALGDDLSSGWTELALDTDISATGSHKYAVALMDRAGKCIGASTAETVALGT